MPFLGLGGVVVVAVDKVVVVVVIVFVIVVAVAIVVVALAVVVPAVPVITNVEVLGKEVASGNLTSNFGLTFFRRYCRFGA